MKEGTVLLKDNFHDYKIWAGLSFLAAFLSMLGPLAFFSSAPMLASLVKPGKMFIKIILILLLAVMLFFLGTSYLVFFALFTVIPSFLLYMYMKGRMDMKDMVFLVSGYAFLLIISIYCLKFFGDVDLGEKIILSFNQSIEMLKTKFNNNQLSDVELSLMKDIFILIVKKYFFSVVFVGVMFLSIVNLFLSIIFFKEKYTFRSIVEDFSKWETPFGIMLFFLLCWGGALLTATAFKSDKFFPVFLNGVIVSGFFYFIQGLSVSIVSFERFSLSPMMKFIILFILLTFVPWFILVTVILGFGLLDAWFHFRNIHISFGGDL